MEYEMIQHDQIQGLKILVDDITYRTPHMHREFELALVISGTLEVSGTSGHATLSAGEMMVFNPWQTHEFHAADSTCTCLFVQVLPDLFRGYFPGASRLRFRQIALSASMPGWVLEELRKAMIQLGQTYFAMEPAYEFVSMQKLNRLFELLIRQGDWRILSSEENQHEAVIQQRLERIMQFVQEHYQQKIFLKQVAEQEHLSESFMTHFVQKHLNMSFQEYVALTRFEHARLLLESTDLSIAEICSECGFSDRRYLNKVCQEQTGMPPREYRERSGAARKQQIGGKGLTLERLYSDEEALNCLKGLL